MAVEFQELKKIKRERTGWCTCTHNRAGSTSNTTESEIFCSFGPLIVSDVECPPRGTLLGAVFLWLCFFLKSSSTVLMCLPWAFSNCIVETSLTTWVCVFSQYQYISQYLRFLEDFFVPCRQETTNRPYHTALSPASNKDVKLTD